MHARALACILASVNAPTYTPKIFEADSTDEQRALYVDACHALAFDPEVPTPIDAKYQVSISIRSGVSERKRIKAMADELGVTQNAMGLTALKVGIGAIEDAVEELKESSDG